MSTSSSPHCDRNTVETAHAILAADKLLDSLLPIAMQPSHCRTPSEEAITCQPYITPPFALKALSQTASSRAGDWSSYGDSKPYVVVRNATARALVAGIKHAIDSLLALTLLEKRRVAIQSGGADAYRHIVNDV